VTREGRKARPQRDCRAGLGTQRGSRAALRRAALFHAISVDATIGSSVRRAYAWTFKSQLASFDLETVPQPGKALLRLTVIRTPRLGIERSAPRRWPAQRFS